jgi:cysteine-rich repeat protein
MKRALLLLPLLGTMSCFFLFQFNATCGDKITDTADDEECDDGNNENDDYCRNNCRLPTCGDAVIDTTEGEKCDDGNNIDGDGCSDECVEETPVTCGDGVLDANIEECDDNNNIDGDGCSAECVEEFCGDNSINDNDTEECDDGNNSNNDSCKNDCTNNVCGDGATLIGGNENCDDSNNIDGDGCSDECQTENPGACNNGPPNSINGSEFCDGDDLADKGCEDFGFTEGELVCSPQCGFDTSGCQ